jgi:hypothetical protein
LIDLQLGLLEKLIGGQIGKTFVTGVLNAWERFAAFVDETSDICFIQRTGIGPGKRFAFRP